jgi:tetratricopeptide (TPR) repeat protein
MSRSELADLVSAYVARVHRQWNAVDRKYVAKLEAGKIRWPNARYREALRTILDVETDEALGFYVYVAPSNRHRPPLVASGERELVTPGPVDLSAAPWTTAGALGAARLLTEVSDVNRRTFLALPAGALLALSTDSLVARMAGATAAQARGTFEATEADLADLAEAGDVLRRKDDECGGGIVLSLAQGHLRHVEELLRTARYTETVGRGLHGYAAEIMRFCGWLSWDCWRPAQAAQYLSGALHCAQVAGDDAVRANVLTYMAGLTLDVGRPEEAMHLAGQARLCLHGTPLVGAVAHAQFAEAAAAAGAKREAREAIDSAWSAFHRANGEGPPWAYWVDLAHLKEMTGRAHMNLGDHERAIEGLRSYVSSTTPGREQARGLRYAAQAYAAAAEPDEACVMASGAVALLDGQVSSARSLRGLRRVRSALEPYDTAAVRELDERLAVVA